MLILEYFANHKYTMMLQTSYTFFSVDCNFKMVWIVYKQRLINAWKSEEIALQMRL